MAKQVVSHVAYSLVQNMNRKNTKAFGKFYPRFRNLGTMTTRDMAEHIADHGTVYTRDIVEPILIRMEECIAELLMDSFNVQLGELGTFYIGISSEGVVTPQEFNAAQNVKSIRVGCKLSQSPASPFTQANMNKSASLSFFNPNRDLKIDKQEVEP